MNEVAIVGIGCRFPGGSDDPDSFWDFLINKRDCIIKVPSDRWSIDKFYDPDPEAPGRMYTCRAGFLEESLWSFDPPIFSVFPLAKRQ
jgi:acyl transferase domain-containing protein